MTEEVIFRLFTNSSIFIHYSLTFILSPLAFIPLSLTTPNTRSEASNPQPTTYNIQPPTYNIQLTTHNLQPTTPNTQLTTHNLQPTTPNTRSEASNPQPTNFIQPTTYNTQHTTNSNPQPTTPNTQLQHTQLTTHNSQHTTHNTQHTTHNLQLTKSPKTPTPWPGYSWCRWPAPRCDCLNCENTAALYRHIPPRRPSHALCGRRPCV